MAHGARPGAHRDRPDHARARARAPSPPLSAVPRHVARRSRAESRRQIGARAGHDVEGRGLRPRTRGTAPHAARVHLVARLPLMRPCTIGVEIRGILPPRGGHVRCGTHAPAAAAARPASIQSKPSGRWRKESVWRSRAVIDAWWRAAFRREGWVPDPLAPNSLNGPCKGAATHDYRPRDVYRTGRAPEAGLRRHFEDCTAPRGPFERR